MHATNNVPQHGSFEPITLNNNSFQPPPKTNESIILYLANGRSDWAWLIECGHTLAVLASGRAGSDTEALLAGLGELISRNYAGSILLASDRDFNLADPAWDLLIALLRAGCLIAYAATIPAAANRARGVLNAARTSRRHFLAGLACLPAAAALLRGAAVVREQPGDRLPTAADIERLRMEAADDNARAVADLLQSTLDEMERSRQQAVALWARVLTEQAAPEKYV